jgi:cytidine deaminase
MKDRLINLAIEAREKAYSPYSRFCVGAALLASDGEIFTGVNIENSSYGATICAERSAFAAAISAGKRDFTAIAIVGAPKGESVDKLCFPCGICRQFMLEFCSESFEIILFDGQKNVTKTMGELLPEGFKL